MRKGNKMKKIRTKFILDWNTVTLVYTDQDTEEVVKEKFYIPMNGGEVHRVEDDSPVFKYLYRRGDEVLTAQTGSELKEVIRREWTRRRVWLKENEWKFR